jgi:CRP/FNR family transcriptional regulator, cyclic AMP receptor protein
MSYRMRVVPKRKRRNGNGVMEEVSKAPYGLPVVESCVECPLITENFFCDLSLTVLQGLDAITSPATYPKGAVLFVEGQEARGVFVICRGRVKLSAGSTSGKALILRIAESGEVVGLPATISGKPYEATAEALEPIQASFIARESFLQFLRENGEAALRVAQILSNIYRATYQEVRYLGLSGSAAGKLARFLLDLAETHGTSENGSLRATMTLTHEEIAEMIGSSRETVTRLFAEFKKRELLEVHGSALLIKDRLAMQKVFEA